MVALGRHGGISCGACDSASDTSNRMEKTRAWCADSIGVSVSLHHERHRTSDYSLLGLSSEAPTDQTKNYTENGFLTAFVLNLSSLNMGDPDNYSERYWKRHLRNINRTKLAAQISRIPMSL